MRAPDVREAEAIVKQVLGDKVKISATNTLYRAYFRHYREIFCPLHFEGPVLAAEIQSPTLKSHADVLRCIQIITANPTLTRDEFAHLTFPACASSSPEEQQYAIKQVVSATFMINCTSKDSYSEGFHSDRFTRVRWEGDQGFADFAEQAFNSQVTHQSKQRFIAQRGSLKAWKLVKRNKIKIRPTNNLLEHLQFDPQGRVLSVFHQTMFLQTQVKRSKDADINMDFKQSLSMGFLPPKLLLETLITIHIILFPLVDISPGNKKSTRLLRKLIRKQNFDPEATWVEFVRPIPDEFAFTYWGSRLAVLFELVKRPPPTNSFVSWFERHTSERNALTAAILGLFLAALFGLLGVIIGVLQLAVSWRAWREPVVLLS